MAFDATYLGEAIRQGGSQIAEMFFKKYQLQEQERLRKQEMDQEQTNKKEILDIEAKNQKDILQQRGDIDKANSEFQIRFSEQVKNAFGSPDLVADLGKAVAGKDDHERLAGSVALQLTKKLGQYQALDEKDEALLPMLSPGSQVAIMQASGALKKQMEDDKIRNRQLDATMELYGIRKDTAGRTTQNNNDVELGRRTGRIRQFGEDIQKAQKELEGLAGEKDFKNSQTLASAGKELPPALKTYWDNAQKRKAGLEKVINEKMAALRAEQESHRSWVEKNGIENAVVYITTKNGVSLPYIYRGKGPDGKAIYEPAYNIEEEGK